MRTTAIDNGFLRYLVENGYQPGDDLPTIHDISSDLDVSVAKVRELIEIARALGLVDIKPGRGSRVEKYQFGPAATLSSLYAIGLDSRHFQHLRLVRNAVEIQFWEQAVSHLTQNDFTNLRSLIRKADQQLSRELAQVPVREHYDFHMTIFSRLENVFVQGILEAFWEAYEAFGLHLYRDISYHLTVWRYHSRIVDALEAGDIELGRRLLIDHMNLLDDRSVGGR